MRARPGEVTILCFSALTNVALAATLEPALPSLLKELVVMGGSIYGPGNMSPLAEANFGMDAAAARYVLNAFAPADDATPKVVLAPLDVTHAALLTQAEMDAAGKTSRAAALLSKAWTQYANFYCEAAGMCDGTPMHDAHTVADAIEPAMYTNVTTRAVQVFASRPRLPFLPLTSHGVRSPPLRCSSLRKSGCRTACPSSIAAARRSTIAPAKRRANSGKPRRSFAFFSASTQRSSMRRSPRTWRACRRSDSAAGYRAVS